MKTTRRCCACFTGLQRTREQFVRRKSFWRTASPVLESKLRHKQRGLEVTFALGLYEIKRVKHAPKLVGHYLGQHGEHLRGIARHRQDSDAGFCPGVFLRSDDVLRCLNHGLHASGLQIRIPHPLRGVEAEHAGFGHDGSCTIGVGKKSCGKILSDKDWQVKHIQKTQHTPYPLASPPPPRHQAHSASAHGGGGSNSTAARERETI